MSIKGDYLINNIIGVVDGIGCHSSIDVENVCTEI